MMISILSTLSGRHFKIFLEKIFFHGDRFQSKLAIIGLIGDRKNQNLTGEELGPGTFTAALRIKIASFRV